MIDWSALEHAYGSAEETPGQIRQLREENWGEAVEDLLSSVLHQGSVYPATLAALPLLAEVALDREAPGRLGAYQVLCGYGSAIAAGASRNRTYLPPGTDLELFDSEARSGLAHVAQALLPTAGDGDPEVRLALYECSCYWDGSTPGLTEMLRARFTAEDDVPARVALMEPLARHHLLTAADLDTLAAAGRDEVLFAAVWSAVACGCDLDLPTATPTVTERLIRLWPEQAGAYPGAGAANSLKILAREAGAGVVPLLTHLTGPPGEPDGTAAALAEAWYAVALTSRAAGPAALDALIDLSARTGADSAVTVLSALSGLVALAPDREAAVADAVVAMLRLDPPGNTFRSTAAVLLFTLRDPRWTGPALDAVRTGRPAGVVIGTTTMSFPTYLGFRASQMSSLDGTADDLATVAGQAVAALPTTAATWANVLRLPAPTSTIVDVLLETVRRWAQVSLSGSSDQRPEAALWPLAETMADDRSVVTPAQRDAIGALPLTEDACGAWVLTARALAAEGPVDASVFERVWELGGSSTHADRLLRIWRAYRSPVYDQVCRDLLTGEATTYWPRQNRQAAAAWSVLENGDPAACWPFARAMAENATFLLKDAIPLAGRIVELEPSLRPEWVTILRDVADTGGETCDGPEHLSVVRAVSELVELREIAPPDALDRVLASAFSAMERGREWDALQLLATALTRVLKLDPALRPRAAQALEPLLDGDTRIQVAVPDVVTDVRLTGLLREALSAGE